MRPVSAARVGATPLMPPPRHEKRPQHYNQNPKGPTPCTHPVLPLLSGAASRIKGGANKQPNLKRSSFSLLASLARENAARKSSPWVSISCPFPLGENVTEEPLVFHQDLRVPAVTEALEERGGPLDVGEEEGDRPGRQGSHAASQIGKIG